MRAARIGLSGIAVSVALFAASGPAAAKPKPITGKLTKPGYTVIALAPSGRATSDRAERGKFRLVPPSPAVTLHLRAPDGTYAGPIVVRRARKGRRAILGIRAGAKLGKVKVKPRKGYAKLTRRLSKRWVHRKIQARARKGVPIGAGVFGRVRSRPARPLVPGDRDLDGVPNPLDIDDDGDLILDNLDRSHAARASQTEQQFHLKTDLGGHLDETVNANAAALTTEQVDEALKHGLLEVEILPGDSAELDCAGDPSATPARPGLIYCSRGGTGLVSQPLGPPSGFPRFPECCDPDGDGFGTLQPHPAKGPGGMLLSHGATSAQIGTGDLLIQHVTTRGDERHCPPPPATVNPACASYTATVQYVFATVPALVSYSDGQGNSATPSYPVTPGSPGANPKTPFPVTAPAGQDVVVTLTFWRPQRRPIPGEPGYSDPSAAWIDIGGLGYSVGSWSEPGQACPQSAYSESDPSLTPTSSATWPFFWLTDSAPDQPASPANTFTFTLNLTQCLGSQGVSFEPGKTWSFRVGGRASGEDSTHQVLSFKHQ